MRSNRAIKILLLIVAVGCLGFYSYATIERTLCQAYESWLFDRALPAVHRQESAEVPLPADSIIEREPGLRLPLIPPPPPPPSSVLGRLSVPRLHMSAMVREGVDRKTPRLAVGHIPGTALPEGPGNVGVAAHRDTFFRALEDVKAKDEIDFSTPRGDFKYEVESLKIVGPAEIGVLTPSSEKLLTMVTCYPFHYVGNAPKRFIVRARQVAGIPR